MNVTPINLYNETDRTAFEHGFCTKTKSTTKEKTVALTSALAGTAIASAIMAKHAGYSLKPSRMLKNIKNSYLMNVDMKASQVCAFGGGSCLGGLVGGYMIDKNPINRKAKRREAVMQFGNISIPILLVKYASEFTEKKYGKKASSLAAVGAVFAGVVLANYLMNKLSNALFHNKAEARKVKPTDFSAHLDDFVLAATYIFPESRIVHGIGRFVPAALMVPGYQIGIKKARNYT